MTTNSYQLRGEDCGDECAFPALKGLIPEYVAGMLGTSAAAALEDHLLDCRPCRENYLAYLKLLGSAFAAFTRFARSRPGGDGAAEAHAGGDAKVVRLEEFKRRRP